MIDELDKKYINEIFNFGLELELFAKIGRIHFAYEHDGHTYIVTRYKPAQLPLGRMVS